MLHITFLGHSGFLVDDGYRCYVFDYYRDLQQVVDAIVASGRELWFFVSHSHGDHYNPAIIDFDGPHTRYICHGDVPLVGRVKACTTMVPGDSIALEGVRVRMYGSTDEGGSFYVENIEKQSVFHAGDLNWWHWLGDTDENNSEAKRMAWAEFDKLDGLTVDAAMFPVDNRLEAAQEWGAIEFLRHVTVMEAFIPMHLNGPLWQPSAYFKALYGDVPIWQPSGEGDDCTIN